jgi:hypothetical protein
MWLQQILFIKTAEQIFVCELLISTMLNPCNANKSTVTEVITKLKSVSEVLVGHHFIIP